MAGRVNRNSRQNAARSTRAARGRNNFAPRNSREKKMFGVIAILATVLIGTIGVAVAAFSTDLYIRGTATVRPSVWSVHFQNLQPVAITGDNAKETTAPTIQTSVDGVEMAAIKNYEVELKDPGDAVEYTFEVINEGDMNAKIDSITINTGASLTCASAGGTEMANKVCANLKYTLKYADGTTVAAGDKLAKKSPGSTANVKTMKLKLELNPEMNSKDLPTKDVTVSNLAVIIAYGQDTETETE